LGGHGLVLNASKCVVREVAEAIVFEEGNNLSSARECRSEGVTKIASKLW